MKKYKDLVLKRNELKREMQLWQNKFDDVRCEMQNKFDDVENKNYNPHFQFYEMQSYASKKSEIYTKILDIDAEINLLKTIYFLSILFMVFILAINFEIVKYWMFL